MNIAVTRPLNSIDISGQIRESKFFSKGNKSYISVKLLQVQRYNDKLHNKFFNVLILEPSETDKRRIFVGNYMFVINGKLSLNDNNEASIIVNSNSVSTVYIENETIQMPEVIQAIKQLKM